MPTSTDPATILMLATVSVAALIAVIVLALVLARVVRERDRLKLFGDRLKQRTDHTIAEQQAEIDSLAHFRDIRDAAATADQLRSASNALYEGMQRKTQEIICTEKNEMDHNRDRTTKSLEQLPPSPRPNLRSGRCTA